MCGCVLSHPHCLVCLFVGVCVVPVSGCVCVCIAHCPAAPSVLPLSCCTDHWNPTVHTLAEGVLKHYADRDPELYARCVAAVAKEDELAASVREQRRRQWESLEKLAAD